MRKNVKKEITHCRKIVKMNKKVYREYFVSKFVEFFSINYSKFSPLTSATAAATCAMVGGPPLPPSAWFAGGGCGVEGVSSAEPLAASRDRDEEVPAEEEPLDDVDVDFEPKMIFIYYQRRQK
jgi:hypothetical protein